MTPSRKHRSYVRCGVRMFMTPDLEALADGANVSYMKMETLEILFELIFGRPAQPPPGYRPRRPA